MNIVQPIRDKKKLQKLLQVLKAKQYTVYVVFQFGLNSGLRVSDVLALNVKDVCNKDRITREGLATLKIKDYVEIREQKTSKPKKFPIRGELKKILKEYLTWRSKNCKYNQEDILFIGARHNRMSRSVVYRNINNSAREAGITDSIGTHTMRKTFGYHFYKQTKDLTLLQSIFNHSSSAVTLRYIGITQDDINKGYNTLNYNTSNRINTRKANIDQSKNIIKAIYKLAYKIQEMDDRLRTLGV